MELKCNLSFPIPSSPNITRGGGEKGENPSQIGNTQNHLEKPNPKSGKHKNTCIINNQALSIMVNYRKISIQKTYLSKFNNSLHALYHRNQYNYSLLSFTLMAHKNSVAKNGNRRSATLFYMFCLLFKPNLSEGRIICLTNLFYQVYLWERHFC